MQLLVRTAVVLALACCAACTDGTSPASEEQREKRYYGLTQQFAEAVRNEDWATAHAFLSKPLQSSMPLEQFAEVHRQARQEYGVPIGLQCDDGFVDPEVLKEGWSEEFPGVPPKNRQAFTHAYFVLERDQEGEVWRCYDLRLAWHDAEGADKVGWFEYAWCD